MTERSYAVMRPGGRLVTLGSPPAEDQARPRGVHAMFFVVAPDPGELAQLANLVDQGRLRPVISQAFPLSEGRRAYESGTQSRPPGKTLPGNNQYGSLVCNLDGWRKVDWPLPRSPHFFTAQHDRSV